MGEVLGALIGTLIILVIVGPILWQIPRTFWPLRLDSTASRFTGLYRRYSIDTFTGRVSNVQTSAQTQTIGSVTAHTSATDVGGYVSATTTISDNRRNFRIEHTSFFLQDQTGATRPVDAANVGPAIANGHLVSAAWIVHNRKLGNAFVIVNHTTGQVYVEQTRRGMKNAPRGLVRMVLKLPLAHQVALWVLIITIPVMVLFGVGVQWQTRWFRKHGVKRLVAALERRTATVS